MDKKTKKSDLLSLNANISTLIKEVDDARKDITNSKKVDLNQFLARIKVFCDALNENPPDESDTQKVLDSIKVLFEKINKLQNELTNLESERIENIEDPENNGDAA